MARHKTFGMPEEVFMSAFFHESLLIMLRIMFTAIPKQLPWTWAPIVSTYLNNDPICWSPTLCILVYYVTNNLISWLNFFVNFDNSQNRTINCIFALEATYCIWASSFKGINSTPRSWWYSDIESSVRGVPSQLCRYYNVTWPLSRVDIYSCNFISFASTRLHRHWFCQLWFEDIWNT